jgi:hypothetical protein
MKPDSKNGAKQSEAGPKAGLDFKITPLLTTGAVGRPR